MLYLIAIPLPFLAMMLAGRMTAGVICLILQLTLIGWPIAFIWAVVEVSNAKSEKRIERRLGLA